MAETAHSIIKDSLQELLVQASEQPIEPPEFNSAVRYLNRMMSTIPFSNLGYRKVSNPSDPITIPDGAIDGVIFSLALRLAASYDMQPSIDLKNSARDSMRTLRKLSVIIKPVQFSDTFHMGSGHYDGINNINNEYYSPTYIPNDAENIKIGEVNSFTESFVNYLLESESITSFTAVNNSNVVVVSSSESNGVIILSVQGVATGLGSVCITATTSIGRVSIRTINFDVKEGCS